MKKLQNTLLVILATFLTLIALEVMLRASIHFGATIYPNPKFDEIVHQYSDIKELVYELKPSIYRPEENIVTNKHGLRDHEYTIKKPANTIRICVLGDSIAADFDYPMEQNFENILERKLNDSRKTNVEVLNFSVIGYNSEQEEIVLKNKVLQFDPDFVIVAVCLNDDTYTDGLGDLARPMHPKSIGSRLHSKLISFLMFKLERIRTKSLKDMNRIDQLFETTAKLGKTESFESLILIFPHHFDYYDEYELKWKHEDIATLAKKHGLETMDFLYLWEQMTIDYRLSLHNDRVHFSPTGMKVIANALHTYFLRKI